MSISPCKGCRRELKDKNHLDCVNCVKRMEYCNSHGSFSESVPLGVKKMGSQKEGVTTYGAYPSGHQICKDEDCKHLGIPLPAGKFDLHHKYGKPFKYCRECMSRKKSLGRKKKYIDNRQEAVPAASLILTIDFAGHQKTLEEIRKTAKKLMREPEAQILYWLTVADFEKLERGG